MASSRIPASSERTGYHHPIEGRGDVLLSKDPQQALAEKLADPWVLLEIQSDLQTKTITPISTWQDFWKVMNQLPLFTRQLPPNSTLGLYKSFCKDLSPSALHNQHGTIVSFHVSMGTEREVFERLALLIVSVASVCSDFICGITMRPSTLGEQLMCYIEVCCSKNGDK